MLHMLAPVIERRFELGHGRGNPPPELLDGRLVRQLHTRFDHAQSRLHAGALYLWRWCDAQIAGQTDRAKGADEPLGRIPLIPTDAVAEVRGEAVMKRVISLAEREQGDDPVVARGDLGVECRLAEEVGERVHEERGVMNDDDAEKA